MSAPNGRPPGANFLTPTDSAAPRKPRGTGTNSLVPRAPDARVIARIVVERILLQSATAAPALADVFERFPGINQRERSLATELVYTTLRMQRSIRLHLSAHAERSLPTDSVMLSALLVAGAELLYIHSTSSSGPDAIEAAASQICELRGPRMAGVANGILTRVLGSRPVPSGTLPTR